MQKITLPPSLTRYQCHKVVSAAKIIGVHPGRADGAGPGATLTLEMPFTDVSVPDEWVGKHDPKEGDYLVVYDDVSRDQAPYVSVSPPQAFEDGYTRIG
jgi:hypothetical protein